MGARAVLPVAEGGELAAPLARDEPMAAPLAVAEPGRPADSADDLLLARPRALPPLRWPECGPVERAALAPDREAALPRDGPTALPRLCRSVRAASFFPARCGGEENGSLDEAWPSCPCARAGGAPEAAAAGELPAEGGAVAEESSAPACLDRRETRRLDARWSGARRLEARSRGDGSAARVAAAGVGRHEGLERETRRDDGVESCCSREGRWRRWRRRAEDDDARGRSDGVRGAFSTDRRRVGWPAAAPTGVVEAVLGGV